MGVALLTGGAIGPLIMGYVSDRNVASGVAAPRMRLFALAGPVMALGVILVALARGPTVALGSEERRVGKECHVVCRSRWSPYH